MIVITVPFALLVHQFKHHLPNTYPSQPRTPTYAHQPFPSQSVCLKLHYLELAMGITYRTP